jgi:hypothetical protein
MAGHQFDPPELPSALAAPGLIIRASISLGAQDIIQFEGFVDRDSEMSEINHICDKVRRASLRQRAIFMLPAERRALDDLQYRHDDNNERLANIYRMLDANKREREKRKLELDAQLQEKIRGERAYFETSGRRGEFKPSAQVIGPIERDLAALAEGDAKDLADQAANIATLENELAMGDRALKRAREMIAQLEAEAADEG